MGAYPLRAHVEVKEEVLDFSLHGVGDSVFLSYAGPAGISFWGFS